MKTFLYQISVNDLSFERTQNSIHLCQKKSAHHMNPESQDMFMKTLMWRGLSTLGKGQKTAEYRLQVKFA